MDINEKNLRENSSKIMNHYIKNITKLIEKWMNLEYKNVDSI